MADEQENGGDDVQARLTLRRPSMANFPSVPKLPAVSRLLRRGARLRMPDWSAVKRLPLTLKLLGGLCAVVLVAAGALLVRGMTESGPEVPVKEYLEAWKDGDCALMHELNAGWMGDGTVDGCERVLTRGSLTDFDIIEVEVDESLGTAVVTASTERDMVGGGKFEQDAIFHLVEKSGGWVFLRWGDE